MGEGLATVDPDGGVGCFHRNGGVGHVHRDGGVGRVHRDGEVALFSAESKDARGFDIRGRCDHENDHKDPSAQGRRRGRLKHFFKRGVFDRCQ